MPSSAPCALTIGNFDGVHFGHCELVRRTVEIARTHGWRAVAMTFDPHPTRIIAPERAPRTLTSPAQRAALLKQQGIDEVVIFPFTPETALYTPDYFLREILYTRLAARAIVVGEDFRFGHKHQGDANLLLQNNLGLLIDLVPAVTCRGGRVSSTRIRHLIEAGQVGVARRLLTRPFTLEGEIVKGHGIGRTQTVPTLNLRPDFEVLPKIGVYITQTHTPSQSWNSITNIGTRPTFDGDALTIETYILSSLSETPTHISLAFLARIRGERKFPTPEALKERIQNDIRSATRFFKVAAGHAR